MTKADKLRPRMRVRWTDEMEAQAVRLRGMGKTLAQVAQALGVSAALVGRHIGPAALMRRKVCPTDARFAVGDRVVYCPIEYGNADIAGCEGTVIYIDRTAAPYTVMFDEAWAGGLTDIRAGNTLENSMRCWFCREENLSLVADASHSVKKTKVRHQI